MGYGYPAAKAVARLAGDISHPEVTRLLKSENIWLRAGALAGLTEARASDVERLLVTLLGQAQPAVIHDHAAVGLALLEQAAGSGQWAAGSRQQAAGSRQ